MHQRILNDNSNSRLLYISSTDIDGNFNTAFHSHPNLEMLLVLAGEGYIYTANHQTQIKKGDLIIINQNCEHYEANSGLAFFAIGIVKTNVYLKDFFKKRIITFRLGNDEFCELKMLYTLIYRELSEKKEGYKSVVDNATDIILKKVSRKNLTVGEKGINEDSYLTANIKSLVDNSYYLDIKLDDIAHKLSESKSNICHQFKRETGKSIIEYRIIKQLEEAANLLCISDMNVSQIASFVGFNSVSYFIKRFKKAYNFTPKEYKCKRQNLQ